MAEENDLHARLLDSGKRLLAALDAEHHRSKQYPKDFTEAAEYLEEVSLLRQRVDECAREYCALLTECGFRSVEVSDLIDSARRDGASGLSAFAR